MSVEKAAQSLSITDATTWSGTQAYILASVCLLLGVALGYLFRGSASPVVPGSVSRSAASAQQESAAQAQAALAQASAPLLTALKSNPADYDSLVKLGNLFYDAQQFSSAIEYYNRALGIHPENADVRTDMGTAYWYTGDADQALEVMLTSLKYRPGHPQTLFNMGWVKWQGKADAKGAVAAWEQLLKENPDYPQKKQVEQYIAKAKEHAARG